MHHLCPHILPIPLICGPSHNQHGCCHSHCRCCCCRPCTLTTLKNPRWRHTSIDARLDAAGCQVLNIPGCGLEGGLVGTLDRGYVCKAPLPRVPQLQSASLMTSKTELQRTCYLQVPCVPTWSNLTRLLAGVGRRILSLSPVWLLII
jgi:hypothetical protein